MMLQSRRIFDHETMYSNWAMHTVYMAHGRRGGRTDGYQVNGVRLVLFRPNNSRTTALSEAGVGLIGSGQGYSL